MEAKPTFSSDAANYLSMASDLLGVIGVDSGDVIQSDMICYDTSSLQRYDELKKDFSSIGDCIDESIVNGRSISVFELNQPISNENYSLSFVELPQPKSGDETEGIDHVQFVTRIGLSRFAMKYSDIDFVEKGNDLNRLLQVESNGIKVRFHDKHIGSVLELEA